MMMIIPAITAILMVNYVINAVSLHLTVSFHVPIRMFMHGHRLVTSS